MRFAHYLQTHIYLNDHMKHSLALFTFFLLPAWLCAQTYPAKPVKLVVPFPAGGATDILGRAVAQKMGEKLGQSIVVENRPGAGGTIGSDQVAKSAPDGYTLLIATSSTHSIGPQLSAKIPYNAQTDFTPIGHVCNSPNVLMVPASLGVASTREFIALAKSKPGALNYGSSGNGTIVNLTGELFKSQAGVFITHIPYRGTALVIPDMKAGQIHMLFDSVVSAQPHLQDGRLKVLGITSAKRSPLLPDVPTVIETLPGFTSNTWFGLYGPKGLPAEITARMNQALNAALQDKDLVERLAKLGAEPGGGSPEAFAKLVSEDSATWGKLIRERKITADQ
jgi:tripartite-type tricarboxylate transporter receptor subunit TctC